MLPRPAVARVVGPEFLWVPAVAALTFADQRVEAAVIAVERMLCGKRGGGE